VRRDSNRLVASETMEDYALGGVVAAYINKTLLKDGVYQSAQAYPIMRSGGLGGHVQVSPDKVF